MVNGIDIKLFVGTDCNQKCDYCDADKKFRKSDKLLLTATRLIEELSHKYKITISVDGGEPFSYPELLQGILSFSIPTIILTNGTLITKENIKWFGKDDVMRISLDGVEEIHNKHRKLKNNENAFLTTMRGITITKENNVPLIIGSTILMDSIQFLEQTHKLIEKIDPIRWILTVCMYKPLDNAQTETIHNIVKPVVDSLPKTFPFELYGFHLPPPPSPTSKLEVCVKQEYIATHKLGHGTPNKDIVPHEDIDKLIEVLLND